MKKHKQAFLIFLFIKIFFTSDLLGINQFDPNSRVWNQRADFQIAGKVVDPNGALLDECAVTIVASKYHNRKLNSSKQTLNRTISKSFDFSFSFITNLQLTFRKEGYTPVRKYFRYRDLMEVRHAEIQQQRMEGIIPRQIKRERLIKYYENLSYHDPNLVIVLRKAKAPPLIVSNKSIELRVNQKNPVHNIIIKGLRDPDQTGISLRIDVADKDDVKPKCYLKATEGAGILLISEPTSEMDYHEVMEAPAGGYTRELEISKLRSFPCLVILRTSSGTYVKCYLYSYVNLKDKKASISFSRIAIQEDGSRNLYTTFDP